MGELQIRQIADLLSRGVPVGRLQDLRGTVYRTNEFPVIRGKFVEIPSYEDVLSDKKCFAEGFRMQATALGQYLLYDRESGFLSAHAGGPRKAGPTGREGGGAGTRGGAPLN